MSNNFITLIMAAGMGKRMKSDLPKVLHQLADKPLVKHVIDLAESVGSNRVLLIVGHKRELVKEQIGTVGVEYVTQEQQRGTADAVESCREAVGAFDGDLLVLSGDVPLMKAETVEEALNLHRNSSSSATVFTFKPEDPKGYGRVIRNEKGELDRIVEHKDANETELSVGEVNAGIYFFRSQDLFNALREVSDDNASGEFYITDTIGVMRSENKRISPYLVKDELEVAGVNNPDQLKELEDYFLKHRKG